MLEHNLSRFPGMGFLFWPRMEFSRIKCLFFFFLFYHSFCEANKIRVNLCIPWLTLLGFIPIFISADLAISEGVMATKKIIKKILRKLVLIK